MSESTASMSEELSHLKFLFYTSLHLVILQPGSATPLGFGSGVLTRYRDRLFLLSVAHVTDIPDTIASIETGLPLTAKGTPFLTTGPLHTFHQHPIPANIPKGMTVEQLLEEPGERLDITFCALPEPLPLPLVQPVVDLGDGLQIPASTKRAVQLDHMLHTPLSRELTYDLLGHIRQELVGGTLKGEYALKFGLQYQGSKGFFHRFLTPQLIKDADDYRGCSGAPIFDEHGRLVGLACKVRTGSKLLYAFSIEECRRLLDLAINAGQV